MSEEKHMLSATQAATDLIARLQARVDAHDKMSFGSPMALGYFSGGDARLMRDAIDALRDEPQRSASTENAEYQKLAEARIARQGRMLGRLRKAIKPFADIALAQDDDTASPDMIGAVDLAISPSDVRAAREAFNNLDADFPNEPQVVQMTEPRQHLSADSMNTIKAAIRGHFKSISASYVVSSDGIERVYYNGFSLDKLADAVAASLAAHQLAAPVETLAADIVHEMAAKITPEQKLELGRVYKAYLDNQSRSSAATAPVETDKTMDAILSYLTKKYVLVYHELSAEDFDHIRGLINGAQAVGKRMT